MISVYSFATSFVVFNVSLLTIFLCGRRRDNLLRYGIYLFLFATFLSLVRLFTPVDLSWALIVRSRTVLPGLQNLMLHGFTVGGLSFTLAELLLAVWGAGFVGFLIRDAALLLRQRRMRRAYTPVLRPQVSHVAGLLDIRQRIVVSPQVETPYTAGVLFPTIYLPDLELSDEEWVMVLRHELTHIRLWDLLIKFLYFCLQAVFWWNPVAHLFMRELDALLEYRCDLYMTRQLDAEDKEFYLATMITVMCQLLQKTRPAPAPVTASFLNRSIDLKQRFHLVLEYDRRKYRKTRAALYVLVVIVFALSYLIIFQPASFPEPPDMEYIQPVSEGTSYIVQEEDSYYLYFGEQRVDKIPEEMLNQEPYIWLEIIEKG